MKLIRCTDKEIAFWLNRNEHAFLVEVLKLYPAVPPAHHRATRDETQPKAAEFQHLLDDALAEQRRANQEHLQRWLAGGCMRHVERHWELTVQRDDTEWLIQVLNDVRVGSWLALGSPEQPIPFESLSADQLHAWFGMEVSAAFQMAIIEALTSGAPSSEPPTAS